MKNSTLLGLTQVESVDDTDSRLQLLFLKILAAVSGRFRNRGMQRITWSLAQFGFGTKNTAILRLAGGARFKINLADGYWTRLLIPGYVYEPDIWGVLSQVLKLPGVYFLDCGANLGYWSVVCGQVLPPGHILAVEAAPTVYEQLAENARLNGGSFKAVWNALWDKDDEDAVIVSHERHHAGSSIVNRKHKIGQAGYAKHVVKTATVDTLCDRNGVPRDAKLIIKLDVEGAEIEALLGARNTLSEREFLLFYEDHGQDHECSTSNFVMHELGFDVFHCGDSGNVVRMDTLDSIRKLKTDVHIGYNFVACAKGSSFIGEQSGPPR